jgi:hypothetical protein
MVEIISRHYKKILAITINHFSTSGQRPIRFPQLGLIARVLMASEIWTDDFTFAFNDAFQQDRGPIEDETYSLHLFLDLEITPFIDLFPKDSTTQYITGTVVVADVLTIVQVVHGYGRPLILRHSSPPARESLEPSHHAANKQVLQFI